MSKVLKTIGAIASVAAMIPGPHQPFAAAIAVGANIGAKITAKKPPARGTITESVIDVDPPRPYLMGETYFAGVLRYRAAYGATLKKVPNPYMWQVFVHSGVGPVDALVQQQFDYAAIGSYYTGFYASDTQLGDVPESTALVPPYGAAPGWGTSSKLSGCAAIGSNYKFDKDGKVFANGVPPQGAIWRGVKVYDPRLDSTFPGGSGAHRLGNESTYGYSANPALHAGMYAYGRYVSGERVFGMGMPGDAIDWQAVAAWANDCDLNGWEISGVIFEGGSQSGPEIKASNLDNICLSGGGRWLTNGAILTFDWHRPRVPLATITDRDLVEGGIQAVAAQSFRERINTVRPQYTSPAHNWQLITANPIVGSTYLTEDEVTRSQSWPFNLVKDDTQAGQLASYAMADSREIGPITFNAGIDWRFYRPGDTLTLDSDMIGYTGQVVIEKRIAEPETHRVVFQFKTETPGKHAFALGKVADPPPTPTLGQTAEERDALAAATVTDPRGARRLQSIDPINAIQPGNGLIDILEFTGVTDAGETIVFPDATLTGLAVATKYHLFWNPVTEAYSAVASPATTQMADDGLIFLVSLATSNAGVFPAGDAVPEGVSLSGLYYSPREVAP